MKKHWNDHGRTWENHVQMMLCAARPGKLTHNHQKEGMERKSVSVLWFGPELVLWHPELDSLCAQRKMSYREGLEMPRRMRQCSVWRKKDGERQKSLKSHHEKENLTMLRGGGRDHCEMRQGGFSSLNLLIIRPLWNGKSCLENRAFLLVSVGKQKLN